ncbi:hypothetical protein [Pyxidicoccus trucidator]|uniref:hypothetical protein n=1 Tax=Pyxidicoccus trucidator TaxID=2709662 RepID=UPI0013DB52BD|nr:hypothetical protein [Pyxidicoccus trucidator]
MRLRLMGVIALASVLSMGCEVLGAGGDSPPAVERAALTLARIDDLSVNEGEQLQVKVLVLNTTQEDVELSVEGLPGYGTFSGDTLVFKPDADSPRETTVTVTATAGTVVDSTRFTVKVLPLFPKPPVCNDSVEAEAPLTAKGERQWKRVPSNTCYELFGVWGSSATDVWAVGAGGTLIHWDGKEWTPFSSPTNRDLRAVSGTGPTDVIAVGGKVGDALPTIIHWDGKVWSPAKWSPDAREDGPEWGHTRGTPRVLLGVHAIAPGQAIAVGHGSRVELNGTEWRAYGFYMGQPHNFIGGFGTYASWGVGPEGSIWRQFRGGFEREGYYRGEVSRASNLFGAWVATEEDVWAVGEVPVLADGQASLAGIIARRNAQGWTSEQSTGWPRFRAVWGATAGDIWAVGLSGLAHWDGTAWTPLLGDKLTSNAIWGTSATDAWRVGPGGRVMHLESAH